MKKYSVTFLIALVIGFLLANFMLNQYSDYNGIKVSTLADEIYFIQFGVYSNKENMEENTLSLENYIYNIENDKYYVYVGITKNNPDKIVNYYKNLGYDTIIKKHAISNKNFIKELENYDNILSETEDNIAIGSIINQVLRKYEEVIISGGKD